MEKFAILLDHKGRQVLIRKVDTFMHPLIKHQYHLIYETKSKGKLHSTEMSFDTQHNRDVMFSQGNHIKYVEELFDKVDSCNREKAESC